jgi:hypothetical protein
VIEGNASLLFDLSYCVARPPSGRLGRDRLLGVLSAADEGSAWLATAGSSVKVMRQSEAANPSGASPKRPDADVPRRARSFFRKTPSRSQKRHNAEPEKRST